MLIDSRDHREIRRRRAIALIVAAGVGLAYGALLTQGLSTGYTPLKVPEPPVRIALVSRPAPAVQEEPPPARPPVLPRLPIEAQPLTPAEVLPAPSVPEPPAAEDFEELAELSAPALAATSNTNLQKDPYAELRGRTYPEEPGGAVLVMAVLLDRHGHVHNAQIMVPSANYLGDLTRLLSLPGTTLSDVPQIPKGEKRWIELRFRYESQTVALP